MRPRRIAAHKPAWRPVVLATAVFIGLVLGGCGKPEPPPVAYSGPTLVAADLGMPEPAETGANGYTILEKDPSHGRFPAGLAVIRLEKPNPLFVCDDPLFTCERGWEIANPTPQDGASWNTLLKTVPEARAIFVLDRLSALSPDCDLKQILNAVRRIEVEMCLIYGPRSAPENSAALGGVIMDVSDGHYLAYIQSEAGILDFEPPRPDRPKHDKAYQDVNYLAARRFERQTRLCMLDLIHRDQAPATTQPSPWRHSRDLRLPEDSVPVYIVPNHHAGS